jgi:hypothetical protein
MFHSRARSLLAIDRNAQMSPASIASYQGNSKTNAVSGPQASTTGNDSARESQGNCLVVETNHCS